MAEELTLGISFQYVKGTVSKTIRPAAKVDVAGVSASGGPQSIGLAWEQINLGDIGTAGFIVLQNLDATNYIQFSSDPAGANPMMRLKAGEPALLRLEGVLYAKANTAPCDLDYTLLSA